MAATISPLDEDKTSGYFSENNNEFLEETGVGKNLRYNDEFLRPYMVSNCNYDILMGSHNTCTTFRYEINYRNFLLLTQGSAQIKLAPPHSLKYLYPIYDYENFEFRSPVNPWDPQPKFIADFDKIKCLEFILLPGKTLYIPAYWWYSIKFNSNTSISFFNYRTYMNNLAVLPYICLHALQIHNVKRNVVKKIDIQQLNKTNGRATTSDGRTREYKLKDSATLVQWLPMAVVFPFKPFSEIVDLRKNMYRNLIVRMQDDGVLPKPGQPARTGSFSIQFESPAT